jgi:CheY-like chemotaxis protein
LESAILNLAINARDAMPNGGSLTVATENKLLDSAAAAALGEVAAGRYVAISIRDTGTGMPKDVLARVFEPFFTTKEVGRGSGLGLSQVYGFARQSGGHIGIESEVGTGTAVRLYLPWTEASESPLADEAEAIQSPIVGVSSVLIVEDNVELRELATQLVHGLGHAACSAGTGAEAIAILEQDPDIDFLFTDILMPGGMTGFELAVEVRRRRPDMAILMTSGFPGNFLPDAQHNGKFDIIRKPFTQAELAAAFARVRVCQSEPNRGLTSLTGA